MKEAAASALAGGEKTPTEKAAGDGQQDQGDSGPFVPPHPAAHGPENFAKAAAQGGRDPAQIFFSGALFVHFHAPLLVKNGFVAVRASF